MNAPTRFRIDWSQVLTDLTREGYSIGQIAHFTGIARTSLLSYRNRDTPAEPSHYRGETLKRFWCETMQRGSDDLPMIPVRLSHIAGR